MYQKVEVRAVSSLGKLSSHRGQVTATVFTDTEKKPLNTLLYSASRLKNKTGKIWGYTNSIPKKFASSAKLLSQDFSLPRAAFPCCPHWKIHNNPEIFLCSLNSNKWHQ